MVVKVQCKPVVPPATVLKLVDLLANKLLELVHCITVMLHKLQDLDTMRQHTDVHGTSCERPQMLWQTLIMPENNMQTKLNSCQTRGCSLASRKMLLLEATYTHAQKAPDTRMHTCTDRRTTRKHNASNPIQWMGRGIRKIISNITLSPSEL